MKHHTRKAYKVTLTNTDGLDLSDDIEHVEVRDEPLSTKTKRSRDDRGEGVISAAIAVLIMAFLGVGMWAAFSNILGKTTTKVNNEVNNCIGISSSASGQTPASGSGTGC